MFLFEPEWQIQTVSPLQTSDQRSERFEAVRVKLKQVTVWAV
jgi:hypothetical protein